MKATAAAKAIPSLSDFLLNLKLKKPISKELASIENTYLRSIDAIPSEIFFTSGVRLFSAFGSPRYVYNLNNYLQRHQVVFSKSRLFTNSHRLRTTYSRYIGS